MTRTNDGFKISQRDLELRGPGEFFGDRQSGLARFKIADLMTDMRVVQQSQAALQQILERDPLLARRKRAAEIGCRPAARRI